MLIELARASVKGNQRRTRRFYRHFDVLPTDPTAPSGLKSLQRCFFCSKSRGIMLGGYRAARFTVGALSLSKDALDKPRRAFDGFTNAAHFDNVDAN